MIAFRTGPIAAPSVRVDREAGVIYGASLCQAVEALGHGVMCDARTLEQVVALGNAQPRGLKARFAHPGACSDAIGTTVGRWRNLRIEGDKAVGDLHLAEYAARSPQGDLRAYVLDMAEEDPQAFGASIAFEGRRVYVLADGTETEDEPAGFSGLPSQRIDRLAACDLVDEAAANRDGLFREGDRAAQAWSWLDQFTTANGIGPERVAEFAGRWLAARGVQITLPPARPASKDCPMLTAPQRRDMIAKFSDKPHVQTALRAHFAEADEPTDESAQDVIAKAEHDAMIAQKDAEIAALRADLAAAQARISAMEGASKEAGEQMAALAKERDEFKAKAEGRAAFAAGCAKDPGANQTGKPAEVPYGAWRTGELDAAAVLAGKATVLPPT